MEIDKKSFVLGMVTAFGECVANEAKRLAFSPPVFPAYEEELLPEIMRICEEQGLQYYLEKMKIWMKTGESTGGYSISFQKRWRLI